MKILLRSPNYSLTEALRSFLMHRIRNAFRTHSHRIQRVDVSLRDTNGPRGGRDDRVRVRVRLRNMPEICVDELSDSPYRGASRALARASEAVVRTVERRREPRGVAVQAQRRRRRGTEAWDLEQLATLSGGAERW